MRARKALLRNPVRTGLIMLAVAVVAAALLFQKSALLTYLRPGETITVQMARDYKIEPFASVVKIAGTKVGVVQSVEHLDNGPVAMTLKVDYGTRRLLGSQPSAVVRPTTVLGGAYYVQLFPGGAPAGTSSVIPPQRVRLPVELDQLLSAVPQDARHGLQGTVAQLDNTFRAGVGGPLTQLLTDAPAALRPTAAVLDAVRGQNADSDLSRLVTNLNTTARVLSVKPGQLRATVDSLADTSRVLGEGAQPVDRTIAALPGTLRTARAGASDLSGMLDKLTATADDARPTVRELDPLLRRLEPTLRDLRPVLDDLHPLLRDANPLVRELVPTVDQTTEVLTDLDGPVLRRVNGPILDELNSKWKGYAPKYPQGGDDGSLFYQQIGYTFAHIDDGTKYQSASSHLLGFQAGAGTTSVEGTGASAQQLQDLLSQMYGPPHHTTPLPLGPSVPGGIRLPDPGLSLPTVSAPDATQNNHNTNRGGTHER